MDADVWITCRIKKSWLKACIEATREEANRFHMLARHEKRKWVAYEHRKTADAFWSVNKGLEQIKKAFDEDRDDGS